MSGHLGERQLNEWVDGTLSARERHGVEAHLASCDTCRASADRLRLLRADLAGLPRSIQPPAHVLMGVRAAVLDTQRSRSRDAWYMRPRPLAAAAVLLVTISSATTALLVRQANGTDAGAPVPASAASPAASSTSPEAPASSPTSLVAVHALERTYEDEIAALQRTLRGQQSALSPETLRVLQTNLDIIDRALGEARAALRADPGNDALTALVRSGYERKLDVLRSVRSHGRASS